MRTVAILVLMLSLQACTDSDTAVRVLLENGYKNPVMTGYSFFACSEDDWYHTGFKAISPTGATISGVVCSGLLFKNATIRFR